MAVLRIHTVPCSKLLRCAIGVAVTAAELIIHAVGVPATEQGTQTAHGRTETLLEAVQLQRWQAGSNQSEAGLDVGPVDVNREDL